MCYRDPVAGADTTRWTPDDFDYALPEALIAQAPAAQRADARLLALTDPLFHGHIRDLARVLPEGALVVLNDSRVVPARMHLARASDGRAFEILWCAPTPTTAPGDTLTAWVRGAKRLRDDDVLVADGVRLGFRGPDAIDPRARTFEVLEGDLFRLAMEGGDIPLPPYIQRPDGTREEDRDRYQTVFARAPGSVAAPTAGLHFTQALLERVDHVKITLHVGPGTFLPMEVDDVRAHRVGVERFEVSSATAARIEAARQEGRPIVSVGTTTTRALESIARRHDGRIVAGAGATDLVITPGFEWQVISGLLTNFHLPRSSLLMLVCSLGGVAAVMEAYRAAVRASYRFYSYGDAMYVPRAP